MATLFPGAADDATTLPNPSATNKTNNPSLSSGQTNQNDAIKAVEAKLGTGASTPTNNTFLVGNGVGTSAWGSLTSAQIAARISDETGSGSLVFASTPTLTTPKVNTINEETAANGVTIDGLNIKDGKLNTNDSVVEANYTDGSIKPEHLVASSGTTWTPQSWTPTWTNMTIGNATTSYRYSQVGKLVFFSGDIILGNTSAVGTAPEFTLPVTSVSYTGAVVTQPLGKATLYDNGTNQYEGNVLWRSTTTARITYLDDAASGIDNDINVEVGAPFGWTTNDEIHFSGWYWAA